MKNIFVILLIFVSTLTYSQGITTFILVRHAEKASDGTSDPGLTEAGEARAGKILSLFQQADITAIYSTNYKRTKMTVLPLSKAKKIAIKIYNSRKLKEFSQMLLTDNNGGTVVISGHSNTTPMLANLLLGEEKLKPYAESDYENLLIITTSNGGEAKLLHLRY